jgi:O-antigen ligase
MIRRAVGWAAVSLLSVGVLVTGFPPGTAVARVALASAVFSAVAGLLVPEVSAAVLCFLAPIAAGLAAFLRASAAGPWAALLVLCFGAGWLFRRMIRVSEEEGMVPPADRALMALSGLWLLAGFAAAVEARTPWALLHGVWPRVVNVQGMEDSSAIRDMILTLASVFAGLVLYAASRRFSAQGRRRMVNSLLAGSVLSSLAAFLQWRALLAAPRAHFWVMVGRYSGFCSDPNALGVLLGVILPVCVGRLLEGKRIALWLSAAAAATVGLAVSGSRSGLAAAVIGGSLVLLPQLRAPSSVLRRATAAGLFVVLAVGLFLTSRAPGSLWGRVSSLFDASVNWSDRVSSRPFLWQAAWSSWKTAPLAGLGWNAFSWNLPNLAAERGVALPGYDNPGNFYLQILCETGVAGTVLLAFFLIGVAGRIRRVFLSPSESTEASSRAAAAAVIALLVALLTGSHLLAVEVSIAFFVLLADLPALEGKTGPPKAIAVALIVLAAGGYAARLMRHRSSGEAFRYSRMIGFYPEEKSPEGNFRWTAARAAFWLAPRERASGVFVFDNPVEPRDDLRIKSQGRVLYRKSLRKGEPLRLSFSAPQARGAALLFENSAKFRPSSFGLSQDGRELSLRARLSPP